MKYIPHLGYAAVQINVEFLKVTYVLYQLKVSQLRPSSWYSLSALPFLYSLELSSFFQSAARGRSCTRGKTAGYYSRNMEKNILFCEMMKGKFDL